jgi:WD40 repeat protein
MNVFAMKVEILAEEVFVKIPRFISQPKFYVHMKIANSTAICFLAIISLHVFRDDAAAQQQQSNKELLKEIEKWKQLAAAATERAAKAEADARRMATIAIQRQREAEISQAMAERAEAAANRARYIAQAKAVAIKSTELSADPEQQALIALQAYKFNFQNQGNPYDNDIYNALRQALVTVKGPSVQGLDGGNAPVLVSSSKAGAVFSGGVDGMILKWTWTKNEMGWKAETIIGARKNTMVFAMDVSPDGSFLAVAEGSSAASSNNNIIVYDLKNPATGTRKVSGFSRIKSIVHTPQGDRAYVLEANGKSIKLTDFKDVREVIKPKEGINVIALNLDGTFLAGGTLSGRVYLWSSLNNFSEKISYEGQSEITALTYAPDGQRMLIGDSQARMLVKEGTLPPRIFSGHAGPLRQIAFNNAGTFVATTADDGVRIWNWVRQSDPPIVLKGKEVNSPLSAVFSPEDQQVLICNGEHTKESISAWPTKMSAMAESLCSFIKRNMTKEEWDNFAGADLPYQQTCENFPNNNK